jgi:hypothetical protein
MYFYPYAAPVPSMLDWTSATAGIALMVGGLIGVVVLATLATRAGHRRVVRTVPMISVVSGHTQIPRAAA